MYNFLFFFFEIRTHLHIIVGLKKMIGIKKKFQTGLWGGRRERIKYKLSATYAQLRVCASTTHVTITNKKILFRIENT